MMYTIMVIDINHKQKGEVMEQLQLPFKFKPYTYESYTDIQKKDYWHTNYVIQTRRIERAEQRLKKLLRLSYSLVESGREWVFIVDLRDTIRDIIKGFSQ